ncbi:type 2 periplasmic-binding domain-containing protein [Sphingobacterium griseoflavum]|uniref:Uncharacterized protein n=1 Tax=Sphingobacterium griseoflavum TaxID=1474952 RepID=A0ABQ3I2S4_9SPHI|nr:hypothetical protein [Sphingobacterium griseoflavum]GHE49176.1 hypothetical protein GCM10017764_35250 [Sphingobacterium griseoflavum]
MNKIAFFFPFLLMSLSVLAQHREIDTDIFGNLNYRAADGRYSANLQNNIFDDLIYTDNRNNTVTFEKKYIMRELAGLLRDKKQRLDLFIDLIRQNRRMDGYVAKYRIDIFDHVIIEDNNGYKFERGEDIFGHQHIHEQGNGMEIRVRKSLNGTLQFSSGAKQASVRNEGVDKRRYEDSMGNDIAFGGKTWARLVERYGSEEQVFVWLLGHFFENL